VIWISIILIYVWPGNVRDSSNYTLYFIFNGILFVDFIFKLPLSVSFLISFISGKNSKKVFSWIGITLSTCLAVLIIFGILIGKNRINIKQINLEFSHLPQEFNNYQIIQFSDIHLGSFIYSKQVLKDLLTKTKKIRPDLIVFTGDLVNNFSYELEGWDKIFQEINKNAASYSILGNHDYGNYSNWRSEMEKTKNFNSITDANSRFGFQLLRNENTTIVLGNDSIYLLGVENWGHPPFPQYANLDQALLGVPDYAFKILMTHDPAHWESQIKGKKKIDLTLSGHTHGLQWGIKPAGIPLSLSYFVRNNWGGLYRGNKSYLYVNTGLGTVGTPWRIDMPAEITVITLKRVKIDGQ
ncbi:metallophosphoesterase, partial [Draconibacterium sp.]|nr:metallophosphoesterase [Draconibacterium sp.]